MSIKDCLHSQEHVEPKLHTTRIFSGKFETKISWLLYRIIWLNNPTWSEILQSRLLLLQTPVWFKQSHPNKGMSQINKKTTCRNKSVWDQIQTIQQPDTVSLYELKRCQGDGGGTCSDSDWSRIAPSTRWQCHRNGVLMARKQVFYHIFCLICSSCINLLSILDRDAVEAACAAAAAPAELYLFSSHVLNSDGHCHCKVGKFHSAESSPFHSCNSTHVLLKEKY